MQERGLTDGVSQAQKASNTRRDRIKNSYSKLLRLRCQDWLALGGRFSVF
jgi:hypothetical protein